MKKQIIYYIIVILLASSITAFSFPNFLNRQGVLRDNEGELISGVQEFNETYINNSNGVQIFMYGNETQVSNGVFNFFIPIEDWSIFKDNNMKSVQTINGQNTSAFNFTVTPYAVSTLFANDSDFLNGILGENFITNTNISWIIDNQFYEDLSVFYYQNETYNKSEIDNVTIIRNHNITWIIDNQAYWNDTYIKVTGLNMQQNPIENIIELNAPDGSSIAFGNNPKYGMFDTITNAIVISSNVSVPEGFTALAFLNTRNPKIYRTFQEGQNFTWSYMRNSQGIFGDYNSTNTSVLQNPGTMWGMAGINPLLDYNTAGQGASLGVQFGIETQKVIIHDDAGNGFFLAEGLIRLIGREGDDIDFYNAPVHLVQDKVITVGSAKGDNITRLSADFDLIELNPMGNENSPNDWEVSINGLCPSGTGGVACAIADNNCVNGAICIMNSTFSTEQLNLTQLSFWLNTQLMTSGGDFQVTVDNGTDEFNVYTLSLANEVDAFLNFTLPSGYWNKSEVIIRFYFTTTHPIRGQVGIDLIGIVGNLMTSSQQNVTTETGKIEIGADMSIEGFIDTNLTSTINIVSSRLLWNGQPINGTDGGSGTDDHAVLTNREWANALHTFLLTGQTMDIGGYDLTTTGTIQKNGIDVCLENGTDCQVTSSSLIEGSGTSGQIALWNGTKSINDSVITQLGGNIGVGTINPTSLLTLVGSTNPLINITQTTINNDYLMAYNSLGNLNFRVNNDASDDALLKLQTSDGLNSVQLHSNGSSFFMGGNVGIGTTTPAQKLEVIGNVNVSMGSYVKVGDAYMSGGIPGLADFGNNEYYNGTDWVATDEGMTIQIYGTSITFYNHTNTGAHTQLMKIESGGNAVIGSGSASTGEHPLLLDVAGATGATHYCDEDGNNCVTPVQLATPNTGLDKLLYIYDAAGGQVVTNSWVNITFDSLRRVDSSYTYAVDDKQAVINNNGWYRTFFKCGAVSDHASSRLHADWQILKNGILWNASGAYTYHRVINDGSMTMIIEVLDEMSNGDYLNFQGMSDSASDVTTIGQSCNVDIQLMDNNGIPNGTLWNRTGFNTWTMNQVGIGTTSPNVPLEIDSGSNANTDGLRVTRNGVASQYIEVGTYDKGRIAFVGGNNKDFVISHMGTTATSDIQFWVDGGADNAMTILEDGNVGIGTDAPTKTLSVVSGASTIEIDATSNHAELWIDRKTTSSTAVIEFRTDGVTKYEVGINNDAADLGWHIANSGQGNKYLTVTSGGSVYINPDAGERQFGIWDTGGIALWSDGENGICINCRGGLGGYGFAVNDTYVLGNLDDSISRITSVVSGDLNITGWGSISGAGGINIRGGPSGTSGHAGDIIIGAGDTALGDAGDVIIDSGEFNGGGVDDMGRVKINTETTDGKVEIGSQRIYEQKIIKGKFNITGIVDLTATDVFRIDTSDETGSNDGGSYSVKMICLGGHGITPTLINGAAISWEGSFVQINNADGSADATGSVVEEHESADVPIGAPAKLINDVIVTVQENTNRQHDVQVNLDLTGSSTTTGSFVCDVTLIYEAFLTAPTLTQI